jgi:hypothetical protein
MKRSTLFFDWLDLHREFVVGTIAILLLVLSLPWMLSPKRGQITACGDPRAWPQAAAEVISFERKEWSEGSDTSAPTLKTQFVVELVLRPEDRPALVVKRLFFFHGNMVPDPGSLVAEGKAVTVRYCPANPEWVWLGDHLPDHQFAGE